MSIRFIVEHGFEDVKFEQDSEDDKLGEHSAIRTNSFIQLIK